MPGAAPYMHHAHDAGAMVDGEEDAVYLRLPAVAEHSNRVVWVDALRRDRTPVGMLIGGENRSLEAVEPACNLLRSGFDDPQVQLFVGQHGGGSCIFSRFVPMK